MANLFTRTDKNGLIKYYGNVQHNGKRLRKYLGCSKETAELALKKLEYDLIFSEKKTADTDRKLATSTISFLPIWN